MVGQTLDSGVAMDEKEVYRKFGISVPDLTGATADGEDLGTGELRFDRSGYTDFGEFLFHIQGLPRKPRTRIPTTGQLSVNGRVTQDSMAKYLSARRESSSALKEILKSPMHYLVSKNENLKPKDEPHFTLGTFIHSAFLQPSLFEKVKVLPEGGRKNSKEGLRILIEYYRSLLGLPQDESTFDQKVDNIKEALFDLETAAARMGYTFISQSDMAVVDIVKTSYRTYGGGIIPRLIAHGRTEVSMYGRDPSTGLPVKIRPDCVLLEEQVGANVILSVKSTSAGSVDAFMRDAAKYRYELAEGMYLQVASEITGRKFTGTLMLVAQTVVPYQVALIWLDAEDLECGKYKYAQAMDTVKQCRLTRNWPGFESYAEPDSCGIIQTRFPSWIKEELKPQFVPEHTDGFTEEG